MSLAFSAPIKGTDGTILGVMTSRIDWSKFEKIEPREKDGQTGHAFIIAQDGTIVAHPKKDKVLKVNLAKSDNQEMVKMAEKIVKGEETFADVTSTVSTWRFRSSRPKVPATSRGPG